MVNVVVASHLNIVACGKRTTAWHAHEHGYEKTLQEIIKSIKILQRQTMGRSALYDPGRGLRL